MEPIDELGTLEAAIGGDVVQAHGLLLLEELPLSVSIAALRLDRDQITILPAPAGGKGSVNFHEGLGVKVTVHIASAAEVDTVCDSGESYGPFEVDFGALNEFESVTPTGAEPDAAMVALINTRSISVCIECTPEFAGIGRIEGFAFFLAP